MQGGEREEFMRLHREVLNIMYTCACVLTSVPPVFVYIPLVRLECQSSTALSAAALVHSYPLTNNPP